MSLLQRVLGRLGVLRGRGRPLPPGRDLGDDAWRDVEFGVGARRFDAGDPTRDPSRHPSELVIDPDESADAPDAD